VSKGYRFHLVYLWLPSIDLALQRVADRVRMGGHHVPEEVVRRRYGKGIHNFFYLYRPLTTEWRFYDNSSGSRPQLIAAGKRVTTTAVRDKRKWESILRDYSYADETPY
jgi:predicted ABC-type ATPase